MSHPSSTPVSALTERLARLGFRLQMLLRRLVCLVRGHRYPHYVINSWSLYFCANGCGREYLRGHLTDAQFKQAMNDLPARPDDADEYGWSEDEDDYYNSQSKRDSVPVAAFCFLACVALGAAAALIALANRFIG